MSLVLTSVLLLILASSSFEVDVEIVMENEPRTEVDTAPHELQAEEKLFGNPCVSKKTCEECIRNHECAWCPIEDMNYTSGGKKRCDYRDTIREECGWEEMVTDDKGKTIIDSKEIFDYWREGDELRIFIWFEAERNVPLVAYRFDDNVPENVQVTEYSIGCRVDSPRNRLSLPYEENKTYCTDVKEGDGVGFFMILKLLRSCPENTDEWNPIMKIHTLYGEHVVRERKVNLGLLCKCECELPENEERNSPKCSGRGTYACGICRCHDNRYGKECECQGKPSGDYDEDDVNKACIAPGDTKICSGRGKCHCGTCECLNKTSVTGRFCECDACPQSEDGQICGGKDHGKCVCGKCECSDGWTGPACDCTKDLKACLSPYNGLICHGFGECKCGKCQCFTRDGNLHKGKYCEKCPTHTNNQFLQCGRYKSCFKCVELY